MAADASLEPARKVRHDLGLLARTGDRHGEGSQDVNAPDAAEEPDAAVESKAMLADPSRWLPCTAAVAAACNQRDDCRQEGGARR